MSKSKSRNKNHPADSTQSPPARPESSEMSGNERTMEISELTFRQQSVLPILAVSRSLAQAARDSGVAESTLRRWLSDSDFRDELDRIRQESYDLARRQAQAVLPACLSVVSELAFESPDPALRFRAARFLITYASRIGEIDSLRADIQDLNEAMSLIKQTAPID